MSSWWDLVESGRSLAGELVIDAHTHMGPWAAFAIPADPWSDGMIASMDVVGIRTCVTAPHMGIGPDAIEGNRQAEEAAEKHPGRIVPYCCYSPHEPEHVAVAELERMFASGTSKRAVGVKIHPAIHNVAVTDSRYAPMWEFAERHSVPVLSHTWGGDSLCGPSLFAGISRNHPSVPILLGHTGGTRDGFFEAVDAALLHDALYADLTTSLLKQGMLEMLVDRIGSERVLFGTDMPFVDCRAQIGYVASARITDEDKRRIFGLNAARLFDLPTNPHQNAR
jgi:uncharacterized protein